MLLAGYDRRLFASANYQGVKKMLDATVLRQEAIASNLANIETLNYKRVDVAPAFATELSRAIAGGGVSNVQTAQPTVSVDQSAVAQNRDANTAAGEGINPPAKEHGRSPPANPDDYRHAQQAALGHPYC